MSAITGEFTIDHDFNELASHDLEKGELQIGLPAALFVLLLVFGAVVAALVPMGIAIVSIIVSVALTALVGQAVTLSFFIVNMITAMGLALGIDYSLFVLSRYREERQRGLEKIDAIVASGATASKAVLFSGSSFVVALWGSSWFRTRSCAASPSARSWSASSRSLPRSPCFRPCWPCSATGQRAAAAVLRPRAARREQALDPCGRASWFADR